MWQNSNCDKTQIVTKLKNSKSDKTQICKLWQNSIYDKTHLVKKFYWRQNFKTAFQWAFFDTLTTKGMSSGQVFHDLTIFLLYSGTLGHGMNSGTPSMYKSRCKQAPWHEVGFTPVTKVTQYTIKWHQTGEYLSRKKLTIFWVWCILQQTIGSLGMLL